MGDRVPQKKWWGLYIVVALLVCGCGAAVGNNVIGRERLDVCMGICVREYAYAVGKYAAVIEVESLIEGDNGPAEMRVVVDGAVVGVIESYFDYDLWTDQPAAYLSWEMVDGDWQGDLVIETAVGERYVVGSENGQLRELD